MRARCQLHSGPFARCKQSAGHTIYFVSSYRSSYSDDGLIIIRLLFLIFTQSIDAIDVTRVTLSRLNGLDVIDVTRVK